MSVGHLRVEAVMGALSLQDAGRPGYLDQGLSRGGAMDRVALAEGAALLRQEGPGIAIEMAGAGGRFRADRDIRIALTGAPMRATLDGAPLAWHASHAVPAGAAFEIGPALGGNYGYLNLGGGVDTPPVLGAQGAHLTAGLGRALAAGDSLPLGDDIDGPVGDIIEPILRFDGGAVRIVPSLQTDLFPEATRARFEATAFRRDIHGNRMGVRLLSDGAGFGNDGGLSVLSEVVVPGDIQVTGDGAPFVLLAECQTTGGYPRIATVLPCDLPRVAQAAPGADLRFHFVSMQEALAAERAAAAELAGLSARIRPRLRSAHDIPDLLAYQLVSGVTAGKMEE